MSSDNIKVKVTPVARTEPNLRKLARALILLARRDQAAPAVMPHKRKGAA